MIIPPRLTLCTYLAKWHPADEQLEANLLVIPVGDPGQPLTNGLTSVPASGPFAGATLDLEVHIGSDPTILPTLADVPVVTNVQLSAPPDQAAIFDEFRANLDLSLPPQPAVRSGSATLKKYLPISYRHSFGFTGPRTELAVIDDSYRCSRRCPPAMISPPLPNDPRISWGELFAMLLRQPEVARAAGLLHTVRLDVGTAYANGGWLFFTLRAGGAFHDQWSADPSFARWFATRVPRIESSARPIFTSVLFPVAADALTAAAFGSLDQMYPEAVAYDDGFAKIVHAGQAQTTDPDDDDEPESERFPPPLKDEGIRLGWDDESMVERLDRGLSATSPSGQPLPDAPSGAAGYRVDVRSPGTATWISLCRITSPGIAIGTANLPAFESELTVEVHPAELNGQYWIPPTYTRWRGGSLVAETADERDVLGDDAASLLSYEPIGTESPPLRYGQSYEFRVRMVDATGGGPALGEDAVNSAEAPVARHEFKRYVPLGRLAVTRGEGTPPTSFSFNRPRIAWPQAAFAGAKDALARLATQAHDSRTAGTVRPLDLPDPNAVFIEFRVLVLYPRLDPLGDNAGFVELYRTTRSFPELDAAGEEPNAFSVAPKWMDCAQLNGVKWFNIAADQKSVNELPMPRGRAVRVEARAMGKEKSGYYGVDTARFGEVAILTPQPMEQLPTVESRVIPEVVAAEQLVSVFLRPDPTTDSPSEATVTRTRPSRVLATRLAGATGLVEDEAVLMDREGRRTIFACRGLKHVMAPDLSSLLLSSPDELSGQWINVLRFSLKRDWSWLGYADASFSLTRCLKLVGPGSQANEIWEDDLGFVAIQHTVSPRAAEGDADRDSFNFCLIDAFLAPLDSVTRRPYEIEVTYKVELRLRLNTTETFTVSNTLPVTTPPRQIPNIVATGHAFSDYQVFGDYEGTGVRERMLWIEFAEPLKDERDAYFARVLASTTDPMLMPETLPLEDPPAYDKPPLDPEFVRVVRPGQVQDLSGLGVVQRLIPCEPAAGQPVRHYLLPLPPTLTAASPELFGFFTYEFIIGHDIVDPEAPWWSTARARFGPPLILEGVQHPSPVLPINVFRNKNKLLSEYSVSSSYARPVHNGLNFAPSLPSTEIWFVVYARLARADGEGWQNLKLDVRKAILQSAHTKSSNIGGAAQALGGWTDADLEDLLSTFGLPNDTPLTFLAVELLPEPNTKFKAPLNGDLGDVRILRTSRLVTAGERCCL